MLGFITFGRVLFAVLFIYTGATKLFAIQATADIIAAKVTVPSALATYTAQLESLTSMTTPQLLAIAIGVIEIFAGLMIALNFGARFFALLLVVYVAVSTFYFYDFWNQAPPDNGKMLVEALKNLSIIGALLIRRAAPGAAGKIHSDFERGFIRAEVTHWKDLVDLGSEAAVKSKGLLRLEGKEYVVADGDVIHFRFNV